MNIVDVKADGHCGYRSIAGLLGMGEDGWGTVRQDLVHELKLFMMSMFNCMDQLTVLLSWFIHYHILTLLLHMKDG